MTHRSKTSAAVALLLAAFWTGPAAGQQPDGEPAHVAAEAPAADTAAGEPVDPEIVKLFLMDGSVIAGKLSVKAIELETQFGKLSIPVTAIKTFTPGLNHHPELGAKIADWVEKLGSVQFEERETAQRELEQAGPAARLELEKRQTDKDTERRTRIKSLLAELDDDDNDETDSAAPTLRDTVETTEFTAVGTLLTKEFAIESKYGPLAVKLADLRRGVREAGKKPDARETFVVDGAHLVQRGMKNSRVRVAKGDKVTITADGQLTMTPWGNGAFSTPDGGATFGWYLPNSIPGGALIGSVGATGKTIKLGTRHSFLADKSGELHFAIAMQNDYANQQFPGKYTLKIRVERK